MEEPLDRLRLPLSALMRWFNEAGLRGAVIGGVAASLRGTPRFTKDIDAVVLDLEAETLIGSAEDFDFVPRIPDALEFARGTRVLLLRYTPADIDIDVSLGALPFEEELVDRSTLMDVGETRVRVASVEDLIIMKAVAGRARDLADIENLLGINPDLDMDRIWTWVREFSSVLEMPEIQETLREIFRKQRR